MSSGRQDSGDLSGALDAYEAAPAIMLALEGEEMVLASANEAARAAFGDRCEYGRSAREIASDVDSRTRELMDEMVGTAVATGRSVTTPAHRMEVWEDDQEPVEVFWDLTVSPWFAEDGSVRGVLAHGVDVTEQARSLRVAADALHDVMAMQDALLPEWLPVLPGVEIAGRYLLAHRATEAGGDWYDAVGLPDGGVALVVGDVPGHGIASSAAMGQLRAVAEERLTSGAGLESTMRALDSFAHLVPEASAATVCVVVVHPATGRLEYCTAGHPPPLVVRTDDGRARFLPHTGASPLATTGVMTMSVDHVECGDVVVLYTDGLLARPGRSPAMSTVELGQVASDAASTPRVPGGRGPADRVCEQALEAMTRATGYGDDVAVLVAEIIESPPPLHLDLPADDDAVPLVLDKLATWLETMRVRDLDHIVVQHAVDELVTNVVEHAYAWATDTGRLTVDAGLLDSGDLEVRFADSGRWAPPRVGRDRGRGLTMVRQMIDRLVLQGADDGTVVTIRHRLSRPAHMLTGALTSAGTRAASSEEPFRISEDEECLQLAGSMDRHGLAALLQALDERADADRVVLDLRDVTRLPSSAVQVLHRLCRDADDRGQDLVLFAPPGTTAQHVLELVRLPYELTAPVG